MDVMAVCKVGVMPLGRVGTVSGNVQRRWPSGAVSVRVAAQPSAKLRLARCNSTSEATPTKNYNIIDVTEKITDEEEDKLSEDAKDAPEPLPEGEPSPFSPAIDMDSQSAASSSLGEGRGASEHSTLSSDPVGATAKSGSRDWRVHSLDSHDTGRSGVHATLEKATDTESTREQQRMYGQSEASCDAGSSFMTMESILENEGGKSVDDYKLRAHIFSESAIFFTALKNRNSHSVV